MILPERSFIFLRQKASRTGGIFYVNNSSEINYNLSLEEMHKFLKFGYIESVVI